jgi:hypothetical protein
MEKGAGERERKTLTRVLKTPFLPLNPSFSRTVALFCLDLFDLVGVNNWPSMISS